MGRHGRVGGRVGEVVDEHWRAGCGVLRVGGFPGLFADDEVADQGGRGCVGLRVCVGWVEVRSAEGLWGLGAEEEREVGFEFCSRIVREGAREEDEFLHAVPASEQGDAGLCALFENGSWRGLQDVAVDVWAEIVSYRVGGGVVEVAVDDRLGGEGAEGGGRSGANTLRPGRPELSCLVEGRDRAVLVVPPGAAFHDGFAEGSLGQWGGHEHADGVGAG